MDTNSNLTNAQVLAAAALAQGNTATKSAKLAGVDRSTLYKWRKTNPEFRKAYCDSRYEAIAEELDKLSELSTIALDQLHDLVTKPDTPATVRLKACLAVLTRLKNTEETGWAVAHATKEDEHRERDRRYLVAQKKALDRGSQELPAEPLTRKEIVQNAKDMADPQILDAELALFRQEQQNSPQFHTQANFVEPAPAGVTRVRRSPECPCGSGSNYVVCCLKKPKQAAA